MENPNSKKLPLFKRILVKIKAIKHGYVKKWNTFKISEDYKATKSFIFDIILLGLLTNLSTVPFGLHFNPLNVICLGSAMWLIRGKVIPMVVDILNSFRLVMVYK